MILTAGHNLVDAPQQYCSDIRVINATNEIHVSPDMIHVCQRYFDQPEELNVIYDYGAILLDQKWRSGRLRPGFAFNLVLGLAPPLDVLQNQLLCVSGYRPGDSPSNSPRRSDGSCVQTSGYQLVYKANSPQGMSGGPVWLGFRGFETVVAIQCVCLP